MPVGEMCGKADCSEICKILIGYSFKLDEQFVDEKTRLKMEFEELDMKIKERKDKLGELKKYQKETEMKQRLEDEETDTLKREMKLLRDKNENYEKEIQNLKSKIEASKNFRPSPQDAALLNSCRHKFQLYKSVTGVRWDFTTKLAHGYVVNKKTYYLKPFSMNSTSEVKLWEEIAKASSADWSECFNVKNET